MFEKFTYNIDSRHIHSWLLVSILLFTAIASFALGFLSGTETKKSEIRIEEGIPAASYAAGQSQGREELGGAVVGSVNSDKYHYPWCSGSKRIKEANKIYFDSKEEARTAGYEPAGNCKGLE